MLSIDRRKLYGHLMPCEAGVDRRALTSPSVVYCQFFELFGAGRSTASFSSCSMLVGPLLPNSHHCGTVSLHMSCYCTIGKSSFSKANNSARSNSVSRWNFSFFILMDAYLGFSECPPLIIIINCFQRLATAFYLYAYSICSESAVHATHARRL